MLSRKKTKNEVSKPAEVQGKYVKKETSPLLRNLMPSFIRHGPTIPRRTDICLPDSSSAAFSASGDGVVSRNQSFLRAPVQRTSHEIMRRESNRLSAPSYLARSLADVPREYGSSQSFLTEVNFAVENGDSGSRYYYSDNFFDGQRRRAFGDRVHEDYRYYDYNHDLFQRVPSNQGRHTSVYLGMINLLLSHTSHSKLKGISPFWYLRILTILQKFLTGFKCMLEPL
ncbi:protein salvador homolog 1 isoform X2 [Cavia porcellus]|uniref:protein salvador homolog 1 isoform X2 n=1 Tax=Cavia porcellus TaxID=10141 RepID=UPI002FDFBB18